jgi:lipoprotein NlpD
MSSSLERISARSLVLVASMAMLTALVGCSSPKFPAPVESRTVSKWGTNPTKGTTSRQAASNLPPAPDGFYRIRRGDTLIGISLDHGVAWRDLAAWNDIDNPNLIEVDQLLRVRPPKQALAAKTVVTPLAPSSSSASNSPVGSSVVSPSTTSSTPVASSPAPTPPNTSASAASSAPPAPTASAPTGFLSWPSKGSVITPFSDPGSKGIALSGNEGDPVMAAGDGRVVYSGSGLRGYCNLVIVKHDGDFLTAYAHNRSILVKEGQAVKRGQQIAELGKSDSDIPKLHFEVRQAGKPVDPLRFLAQR